MSDIERTAFDQWWIDLALGANTPNWYTHDGHMAAKAAWQAARAGGESRINWTAEQPASKEIPYNHVLAETPFGRFEITWKGWKDNDCPTVDETPWGDFFGGFATVDEAKAACEAEYARRLGQCGVQAASAGGEVAMACAYCGGAEKAVQGDPVPEWKSLHKLVDDYIEGYEFRGDDGDYHPTDQERFLIEDCVAGIMHELQEAITAATKKPPAKVPEWVYDGYAIYSRLTDKAKQRTSGDNVSDTLDAIKAMLINPPTQEGE